MFLLAKGKNEKNCWSARCPRSEGSLNLKGFLPSKLLSMALSSSWFTSKDVNWSSRNQTSQNKICQEHPKTKLFCFFLFSLPFCFPVFLCRFLPFQKHNIYKRWEWVLSFSLTLHEITLGHHLLILDSMAACLLSTWFRSHADDTLEGPMTINKTPM